MREILIFFRCFISNPRVFGAGFPCTLAVARKITKHIVPSHLAQNYLEVGAGTGVFTKKIIEKLKESDAFDVVEYDEKMYQILKEKFGSLKNVHIHHMSIIEFDPKKSYDVIVSALPFNSFRLEDVDKIFKIYKSCIKKGGSLSYFEYMGVSFPRILFSNSSKRKEFKESINMRASFTETYGVGIDRVWRNIPPARVIHCKVTS